MQALRARPQQRRAHRIHGSSRRRGRQRSDGIVLRTPSEERPGPTLLGDSAKAAASDRRLDRGHLPPTTTTRPGPFDANRTRDHHDHNDRDRGLRKRATETLSCPSCVGSGEGSGTGLSLAGLGRGLESERWVAHHRVTEHVVDLPHQLGRNLHVRSHDVLFHLLGSRSADDGRCDVLVL